MKAKIVIQTAEKSFSQDQIAIMKRVARVLIEHNLSVVVLIKEKEKMENLLNNQRHFDIFINSRKKGA